MVPAKAPPTEQNVDPVMTDAAPERTTAHAMRKAALFQISIVNSCDRWPRLRTLGPGGSLTTVGNRRAEVAVTVRLLGCGAYSGLPPVTAIRSSSARCGQQTQALAVFTAWPGDCGSAGALWLASQARGGLLPPRRSCCRNRQDSGAGCRRPERVDSAAYTLLLAVLLNAAWLATTALAIFVAVPFAADAVRYGPAVRQAAGRKSVRNRQVLRSGIWRWSRHPAHRQIREMGRRARGRSVWRVRPIWHWPRSTPSTRRTRASLLTSGSSAPSASPKLPGGFSRTR